MHGNSRLTPAPRSARAPSESLSPRGRSGARTNQCPGDWCEGAALKVFSHTSDEWADGKVANVVHGSTARNSTVRVEYEIEGHWHSKTVPMLSKDLGGELPTATRLANN